VLCAAAPRDLVDSITHEAQRRGLRLSITTAAAAALRSMHVGTEARWIAICAHTHAMLMLIERRGLRLLRILRFGDGTTEDRRREIATEVHRACLREGRSLPTKIYLNDESPAASDASEVFEQFELIHASRSLTTARMDAVFAAQLGVAL
jgi:hypothetical protein